MTRAHYIEADIAYLCKHYADTPTRDIAQHLARSERSIYSKAGQLGLKKSAEFLASAMSGRLKTNSTLGKSSRFKPRQTPWNKGTHFISGGRSAEHQFKPGRRPWNHHPIGHERLSKDGYLQIKMTDTGITRHDYVFVHRMVWETEHGAIPADHVVIFKDGNKKNIDISNLQCLIRAELMAKNTVHNLPKPLADLVQLRGAITRQINKRQTP